MEAFHACCWPASSLTAEALTLITDRATLQHTESLALTTCQRIERYSVGRCDCDAPQRLTDRAALHHLAEVAAGLHSVVLGEDEVMGQVRAALREAPPAVQPWGRIAIAAARQLRREEIFDSHSGHLLDRALKLGAVAPAGRILVIGTGKMGKLVATRAAGLGFDHIIVAGRREDIPDWVSAHGFDYRQLTDIPRLTGVEMAVGCLGSAAGEFDVSTSLPPVRGLLLDLGTPRNFTGEATVPLLTIAQLLDSQHDHRHSVQRRAALRERLHAIIETRLAAESRDSASATGALRLNVEQVRQHELTRIQRLHPTIPPQTLDAITRSLVNQLFHLPSTRLANMSDPDLAAQVIALFAPAEAEASNA